MPVDINNHVQAAELILLCPDLDRTLTFFTDRLGFRIDAVFPADDPVVAVVSGYGVRLRLQRGGSDRAPVTLRLRCRDVRRVSGELGAAVLTAPNGTRIELVEADPPLTLPPPQPSFVVSRLGNGAVWHTGRAGMRYRDLIPDRQGGRFIASHIGIPDGGPVPDYVHFHKIRFQMIYCYKGWVRVVYEDQGEPFVMRAGDCVLQPPTIRHRVLESSPGLEVIEIGCPAEHETLADHELTLPTAAVDPAREFGGQRFVRFRPDNAAWGQWRLAGFEAKDTGIAAATQGLAEVRVVRPVRPPPSSTDRHDAELLFLFVLSGSLSVAGEGQGNYRLNAGDACTIPARQRYALADCSDDLNMLEVMLPAA